MKKTHIIALASAAVLLLAGCAAGPNGMAGTPGADGETAGFLMGLWHGCISFVTFLISLFSDKVNVYEIHNNGGWYNFGFLLGVMIAYGGSGGAARKSRK